MVVMYDALVSDPFYRASYFLQDAFTFERAVVTPYTFATVFLPAFLGYYAMAVLVQLPGTRLSRGALLPVVLWMALRANMSLDFSWNYPGLLYLNQGLALAMFTLALRSTAWTVVPEPYARLPIHRSSNNLRNGDHDSPAPKSNAISIQSAMWNAWDLVVNLRGIGWNWSQRLYIPKAHFQVESRSVFLVLSLCRLVFFTVAFDAACRCASWFGPDTFGSFKGGTIFDPSLPAPTRYLRSTAITMLSGFSAYFIVEAVYQLHAVEFVILFQQYPSQWPPLFDAPWMSTSLASFWGRRWHQLFRELMEGYFGRAGIVMGSFAVSGVLHDVGMQGMGRGTDTFRVMAFFLLHGVGVIMEYTWNKATGRRVGGFLGWLWTSAWVVLGGNVMVDVWARRGLMGSEFFPEPYRPTTLLLNLWHSWK
ncbi:hypothetical protein BU15DRAFT_89926 [Melanogaster broomeanus]|nr:hypothetical protein BU15DRAFT_89926 [Melanogaster broomeanus]